MLKCYCNKIFDEQFEQNKQNIKFVQSSKIRCAAGGQKLLAQSNLSCGNVDTIFTPILNNNYDTNYRLTLIYVLCTSKIVLQNRPRS